MRKCSSCDREFEDNLNICPIDGTLLSLDGIVLDEKYHIDKKIGQGGMGQVYLATHTHIGTKYAIKVLDPNLLKDSTAMERFRREARAAAQIHHPNAVLVTDFGANKETNIVYLVMEFLEGESLKERINREGQLEYKEIVDILNQTCSAIEAAHSKGIIHRDLKPDNIYLVKSEDGKEQVKVLDFGIAKIIDDKESKTLTEAGELIGTPQYMSPEQCRGETLDARADIYSLGIILYQMLTGQTPFHNINPVAVVLMHTSQSPRSVKELRADVPRKVLEIVEHALEKKRENRYDSAIKLAQDFEAAIVAMERLRSAISKPRQLEDLDEDISLSPNRSLSPEKSIPPARSVSPEKSPSPKPKPIASENRSVASEKKNTKDVITAKSSSNNTNPEETDLLKNIKPIENKSSNSNQNNINSLDKNSKDLKNNSISDVPLEKPASSKWLLVVLLVILLVGGGSAVIWWQLNKTPKTDAPLGMVLVSGGIFKMGNNLSDDESEKPEHEVTVKSFYMDKCEVTNEQYFEFVRAKQYITPPSWVDGRYPLGEGKYPVNNITWSDASAYALWAGKRLPTEEEWEYAARGSDGRLYPWGSSFVANIANTKENIKKDLMPVGNNADNTSPFGVLDMAGNVAEWTTSDYVVYPESKAKPQGGYKVVRGGSYITDKVYAMATSRAIEAPETRDRSLGFRCVKDIN